MKFSKFILSVLAFIFLINTSAMADEINPLLIAGSKNQKEEAITVKSENINLDNSEIIIPQEEKIAPVFKKYEPAKNEVVFSYTKNLINAIDPTALSNRTGSYLPGARGINQLVVYTPNYGPRTNTNEYGAEAIVEGNTVTELSGADSLIPPNGIVISGHGRAKNWMNSSIKVGTKIYIDKATNLIYTYTTSEEEETGTNTYTYNGISYTQVDLKDYLENLDGTEWQTPEDYEGQGLETADGCKEYVIMEKKHHETPTEGENIETIDFETAIKEGISTGEYKLVIKAYYQNTLIQTIRKSFIVVP